jgi:hypothetical protein
MHNANDLDHTYMDRVVHVGMFGLGHRLSKLAAAHHLAERLGASVAPTALVLEVRWNDCDIGNPDGKNGGDNANNIFRRFFSGSNEVPILRSNNYKNNDGHNVQQPPQRSQGKTILVRNDVHGYYAGQAYKNFQIPIDDDSTLLAWRDKLESDRRLFLHLRDRFFRTSSTNGSSSSSSTHGAILRDFQKRYRWEDHHVIGVHIRAGNGETGHFADAQRATTTTTLDHNHGNYYHNNSTTMIIPRLLEQLMDQLSSQKRTIKKPFLIFVATDTVEWIEWIQTALPHIPVISFPQPRVDRGKGVSFSQWKGMGGGTTTADADPDHDTDPPADDRCYAGWVAAATDMFLLAATDTLVATTRSTFTQILPLALVLGGNGTFCEVRTVTTTNTTAATTTTSRGLQQHDHRHRLACFTDLYQWLFGNDTDGAHKVMVHLPDIVQNAAEEKNDRVFDNAQQFLVDSTTPPDNGAKNEEEDWRLYYYGRKYNPRYREKRPFRTTWTWVETGPALK